MASQPQRSRPQADQPHARDQHDTRAGRQPPSQPRCRRARRNYRHRSRADRRDARQPGDRLNGRLGQLPATRRQTLQGAADGSPAAQHTKPVRHHHQQITVIDQRQLPAEKLGVGLRLAPQSAYRPQIRTGRDHRHSQRPPAPIHKPQLSLQLRLLLDRRAAVRGNEQRTPGQHVTRRITISPGAADRPGRQHRDDDTSDQRDRRQPARSQHFGHRHIVYHTPSPAEAGRGRAIAIVVIGLALMISGALPAVAQAHGPIDPAASSYLAHVKTSPPGVQVRVIDGDLRLWMRVSSGRRVTVLDYQGVPYVRFTTDGVQVNKNSAMYYLNQTPPEIPPTTLTSSTPPGWHTATSGDSYEWHDGRLHALATTLSSPGARDLGDWTIPLRIDGHRAEITGVLDQAPAPSAGWWWPIAVVLLGLPAILRLGNPRLNLRVARGLTWVALAAFMVASLAAGLHGRPGLAISRLLELTLELLFTVWAAWNLYRRRHQTVVFFLVGFAALGRGVAAIAVMWRGYVLLALPAPISRTAVVTCLSTAIGLLGTVWVLSSPKRPTRLTTKTAPGDQEPQPQSENTPVR